MIHQLLATLPKAAAIALGSVAIVGGAVGAAASAGGNEVPGPVNAVFSALGFGLDSDLDDDSGTAVAGRGKAARATGTALPGKDLPSTSSIPGLCRAYTSGSERGREQKLEATAFKRLQNAADASDAEDLDDYCEGLLAERKPTPVATSSAAGRTREGQSMSRGKSEEHRKFEDSESDDEDESEDHRKSESHRKSEGHGKGYSPAAITSGNAPATKGNSKPPRIIETPSIGAPMNSAPDSNGVGSSSRRGAATGR